MLQIVAIVFILISQVLSRPTSQENSQSKITEGVTVAAGNDYWSGLWPGGVVPYEIVHQWFAQEDLEVIQKAMHTIEAVVASRGVQNDSCQLKFVPRRQQDQNFVHITSFGPDTCWSYIGMKGGLQELSLGLSCLQVDTVVHELLHVLGFEHQHVAPNRDDYVDIIWENIAPGEEYNFVRKNSIFFKDYNLGYDFESIMHYPDIVFAKPSPHGGFVGPTMVHKDRGIQLKRNMQMSQMDKTKLLMMYCKNHTQYETEHS